MLESRPLRPLFIPERPPMMDDVTEEELELIRRSRRKDLENIRIISVVSVIPLTLISFLGGYLIAYRMLKPLEELDREMKGKNAENLHTPIPFQDNGDEISSLIKQFNSLSLRVANSFRSQKEFVENASHEIKTPLAVIQANLELALDEKDISKKELNNLLQECKNSVAFMNKLTEDLLLFSLIETEMTMQEINLNTLLTESISLVKPLLNGNGFEIKINCPEKIKIKGNETLLIRSFQNIIENSVKYSGGTKLGIKVLEKDEKIYVSFKDDGKGIPKDQCEKIFNRFYRLDKSRSRKFGGSGLGLAVTKEIIERHGGEITCKSEVGKGTEFKICLQ